jgi:hypothetical protein
MRRGVRGGDTRGGDDDHSGGPRATVTNHREARCETTLKRTAPFQSFPVVVDLSKLYVY